MIDFRTTEQRRVEALVTAVNELYRGRPLPSGVVGQRSGLGYHQALIYLHRAADAGLVKPVYGRAGGAIRGWVPAGVDASVPLAEQKARRAADALREAYRGKPLSAAAVARHMGTPAGTIKRWLWKACLGLVREAGYGWKPA